MATPPALAIIVTSLLYVWSTATANQVIVCPEDCDSLDESELRVLCYNKCRRTTWNQLEDTNQERDELAQADEPELISDEYASEIQTPHFRLRRNISPLQDSSANNQYFNKRAGSFVRIGRSLPPWGKRVSSFVRIGRSDSSDYMQSLLGGSADNAIDKRASSFVRIGKSGDKRASSFVRIGRNFYSPNEDLEKRASSFVRIGKDVHDADLPEEKRKASFVRIGKSGSNKRASSFVRIGKSPEWNSEEKRASSFVRIGRTPEEINEEKRASSFVRIGKSSDTKAEDEKRASSFVRIGKSASENLEMDERKEKKASSFVRIG